VIGARPSEGKTSFALQLARDFADQNIPTMFLSLEMDEESLLERMYCNMMEEHNYKLRKGGYVNQKMDIFTKYLRTVKLIITCGVGKNWNEVLEAVNEVLPRPKVIILDYIQVVRMCRKDNRESIDEYLTEVKRIAIEQDLCFIVCSQINRGAAHAVGNMPSLAMLKGSGALEEAADKVLLLHWPYRYDKEADKGAYKVIVAKNRNGATGEHDIRFEPEYYLFSEKKLSDTIPHREGIN